MKSYLEDGLSVDKITTELSDENAQFYFATFENNVIGYLKLNLGTSQTELKDDKSLEIERLFIPS